MIHTLVHRVWTEDACGRKANASTLKSGGKHLRKQPLRWGDVGSRKLWTNYIDVVRPVCGHLPELSWPRVDHLVRLQVGSACRATVSWSDHIGSGLSARSVTAAPRSRAASDSFPCHEDHGVPREAYLSAQRPPPSQEARLPRSHEHPRRPCRVEVTPRQGPGPSVGLIGRIHTRSDFQRLRRDGRRVRIEPFWCSHLPDPASNTAQVAFAINRAVGNAVTRNRLRRRFARPAGGDGPRERTVSDRLHTERERTDVRGDACCAGETACEAHQIVTSTSSFSRPQRWAIRSITWYQRSTEGRPSPCRFFPSCSSYAAEAFQVHGTRRGMLLTVRRLLRCRPFGPSGFDPVPEALGDRQAVEGPHPSCAHAMCVDPTCSPTTCEDC